VKLAVYPGSFDPVTNGHLDILKRASRHFDKVIVAILRNPEKKAFFSVEERVGMLTAATKSMRNVLVDSFDGLLVHYAKKKGAAAIIRGLRAVSDFDVEFQMALFNRRMAENIETFFMMTDYKYAYLSSSLAKQIARLGGDVRGLVPPIVERYLKKKKGRKSL